MALFNPCMKFEICLSKWKKVEKLEYFKNSKTDKNKSVMDGLHTFIKIVDMHNIKASFFIVFSTYSESE